MVNIVAKNIGSEARVNYGPSPVPYKLCDPHASCLTSLFLNFSIFKMKITIALYRLAGIIKWDSLMIALASYIINSTVCCFCCH